MTEPSEEPVAPETPEAPPQADPDQDFAGTQSATGTEDPQSMKTEVEAVGSADGLFPDLADTGSPTNKQRDMSLLMDIPIQLTVELGRKRVPIKHVLQLAQGSVIELDAAAGEPMDVLVNGCLIAQGEVVVVNERFGIRLTEIVTPSERIRRINRH